MCARSILAGAAVFALTTVCVVAIPDGSRCEVRAHTDAGRVCGLARWAEGGVLYASFRAVPYAKQPLGHLRFKELDPPEPWHHLRDATVEGPVCHQEDVIYGSIMQPRGISEACIHANVHVPLDALPYKDRRRRLAPPLTTAIKDHEVSAGRGPGLPVVVFVHGGGFQGGSGDSDLHGPEYLVAKNVVVITFNYRLNAFGFLSLNNSLIPGNQGLRDQVTLLRWVQRNARAFGGDPTNVTLMGQSAGATSIHLLTLSKATKGLFKRAFMMSGTAISGFYSASPLYAQQLSTMFLTILGINTTDPAEEIHRRLIQMPVEKINDANRLMINQFGLTTFMPTVESEFPGVTRVLDEDPEVLVANGRGKDVPLVIGFTDVECEVFRRRLDQINIGSKINDNLIVTVPANVAFTTPPDLLPNIAKKIDQKYYNSSADTDKFIKFCTDGYYQYPALKLAEIRAASGGAPVYLYRFSYNGDYSVLKDALDIEYEGAAHIEDLTYLFRVNSMLGIHNSFPPEERDDFMKDWMTTFLINFTKCSKPVCKDSTSWPQAQPERLRLQEIHDPDVYRHRNLTEKEQDIIQFFDSLRQELRAAPPWYHYLDTTEERAVCPQHDEIYSRLMKPLQGMSEACIFANVHVPVGKSELDHSEGRKYLHADRHEEFAYAGDRGFPILVYIHGGAFRAGSGDADLNGPEYLVSRGVVVITFNYRINVFGFLYLNNPLIPGNQGLRDQVTLLRWVQRNARAFGGDPTNVTLMGQSAGAACAHLLSLSKVTDGLFQRVILSSGTATPGFYTTSALYSKAVATLFLTELGINFTDPIEIHEQLVTMPLNKILLANSRVQYMTGLVSFVPVEETPFKGVTRVLDDDPIELIKRRRGNRYPLMVGMTTAECSLFRPTLEYFDFKSRIETNPTLLLRLRIVFRTPPTTTQELARRSIRKYFKRSFTYDEYERSCSETLFVYPAFQLVNLRVSTDGAAVFLYQYAYKSQLNFVQESAWLYYNGTVHIEDLVQIFKPNAFIEDIGVDQLPSRDEQMKNWMTKFVVNFMICSNPTCSALKSKSSLWPEVQQETFNYQKIVNPEEYLNVGPTLQQWDTIEFNEYVERESRRAVAEQGTDAVTALMNNSTQFSLQRPRYPLAIVYRPRISQKYIVH